jgi:hypothetical protein
MIHTYAGTVGKNHINRASTMFLHRAKARNNTFHKKPLTDTTQFSNDRDDLNLIQVLLRKAQQTHTIMQQNLTWALLYNLIALPLAAAGMIPPWGASIGTSMSSLIVVLNATRLK